jgi:hypothetical protein
VVSAAVAASVEAVTTAVVPAASAEILVEALPAVTAQPVVTVPVVEDDEETAVTDASSARVVRSVVHPASVDAVAVVASGSALVAQQAAALVFQFGNTPSLSVPLAAAQHLADPWFLALGRGTDLADRALLVNTFDETSGWSVPGPGGSAPAADDLDGQLWDGVDSDLDWLAGVSAAPAARRTPSANRSSEVSAAAVVPEHAALDQYFAGIADDTTDQVPDDE